jgi:hypothetical protein
MLGRDKHAVTDESRRDRQYKQTIAQTCPDDELEHGGSYRIWLMRSAARTTTRSRSLRPAATITRVASRAEREPALAQSAPGCVQPYSVFAVAVPHDGVAWKDQAGHGCAALNHNSQVLADIEPVGGSGMAK